MTYEDKETLSESVQVVFKAPSSKALKCMCIWQVSWLVPTCLTAFPFLFFLKTVARVCQKVFAIELTVAGLLRIYT